MAMRSTKEALVPIPGICGLPALGAAVSLTPLDFFLVNFSNVEKGLRQDAWLSDE